MVVYQDQAVQLLNGDVLAMLKTLPSDYVQTVVTSPPYWGLRDYGMAGQIGLELTPDAFVSKMVDVFQDVWRVLKKDGTLWLNLGDCYATGAGAVGQHPGGGERGARWRGDVDRIRDEKRGYRADRLPNGHGNVTDRKAMGPMTQPNRMPIVGLKPKDMVGMPWRVAFALQADGWYLRSDIIWSKPNPMPESVTDRPTKAHEYLFLFTKQERYYYDADAIKEPAVYAEEARYDPGTDGLGGEDRKTGKTTRRFAKAIPEGQANLRKARDKQRGHGRRHDGFNDRWDSMTKTEQCSGLRNKRSVWTVGTAPFPDAHFATFPEALIEPCILAGAPIGGLVLDPFSGAATTLLVAKKLNRRGIGIELNPDYCAMSAKRLSLEPARML